MRQHSKPFVYALRLLSLAVALLLASGLIGQTVTNLNTGSTYTTIQAAISDALTLAGHTIEVGDGTYNENVNITKSIKLVSVNGSGSTTIAGSNSSSLLGTIHVSTGTNGVQIGDAGKGFTILGIDGTSAAVEKAAVYLKGAHANMVIKGNVITAKGEYALLSEYNTAVTNLVVTGNTFDGQTFVGTAPAGDGFSAQSSLANVPRQVVVISGGSGVTNTKDITFTNNVISAAAGGISTTDNTGAIVAAHPQGNTLVTLDVVGATVTGNTFSGTTARYAEALRMRGTGTHVITGNTFSGSYPNIFSAGTTVAATGVARALDVAANNQLGKAILVSGTNTITQATALNTLLAAATAGSTINIYPATYAENLTISKSLILVGANDGKTCDGRTAETKIAPASGVPITISADNVTIKGFEITAPSSNYAVRSTAGSSNLVIQYNNVHHVGTTVASGNTHAILYQVASIASTNVAINDNCLSNINNVAGAGSGSAIGIQQSVSTGTLTGLNIERNIISDVKSNPASKGAYGIHINVGGSASYLTTTGKVTDARILNNDISAITGLWTSGISLEGNTENAWVKNNSVYNLTSNKAGDRAGGGYDVSGLKFENNKYVSTCVIENNSFATNTFSNTSSGSSVNIGYAVSNYVPSTTGAVTLGCNWFGSSIYAEIGDNEALTGRIFNKADAQTHYDPWITAGTDGSTDLGFQPSGSCTGYPLTIGNSGYSTLQEAATAADGQTFNIPTGTYYGGLDATTPGLDITMAPGSSPGCPTIVGGMSVNTGDVLAIELNGTMACTQYDQVKVIGAVSLGGVTLNLSLGYEPGKIDQFVIIDNDGTDPVNDVFLGGPYFEVTYNSKKYYFVVNYNGGDGNDVVLTNATIYNTTKSTAHITIQNAIDNASAGDVIEIGPYTYSENVLVDKRLTLNGAGKTSTIIQSATSNTPVMKISGSGSTLSDRLVISNLKLTGATGVINSGAGILVDNGAGTSAHYTFDNIVAENNQGVGLAFNNITAISDVIISNAALSGNGTGLRIASSVASFDGLAVSNTAMNQNASSAFAYNPSGTLTNVGTNFSFTDCSFSANNTSGQANQHDLSFFGFHGKATLTNVAVSAANTNAYALVFTNSSTYVPSDDIILNNVDISGSVLKGALSFQKYSNVSKISLTDVSLKDCAAGWGQLILDHTDADKFLVGNTEVKSISSWNTGGADLSQASFYDVTTGALLDRNSLADCFKIADQIVDKVDNPLLGYAGFKAGEVYVTPKSFATPGTTVANVNNAVSAATAGDIIYVQGGAYTGAVAIAKALDIRGANYGTGGCATRITESALTNAAGTVFTVSANNVKIDGFELNGLVGVASSGVYDVTIINNRINAGMGGIDARVIATASDKTFIIKDNCIDLTTQVAGGTQPTVGISLVNATGTNPVVVSGNKVTDAYTGYFLLGVKANSSTVIEGGSSDPDISGVMQAVVVNNTQNVPGLGVVTLPSDVTVKDFQISGFTGAYPAFAPINFHAGVYAYTGAGTSVANQLKMLVKNVSVSGTGVLDGSSAGMLFADFTAQSSDVMQDITIEEAVVANNDNRGINVGGNNAVVNILRSSITNNGGVTTGAGGNIGIGLGSSNGATVNISNSFIENPATSAAAVHAMAAFTYSGGNASSLVAENNSIVNTNSQKGDLVWQVAPSTAAVTCNWWGTANPSQLSTYFASAVDITPYLDNGTDGDASLTGFQLDPSASCTEGNVRVYTDLAETDFVNSYTSIQQAIDATTTLAGYVVKVMPGTYDEQVRVNKSLILRGDATNKPVVDFTKTAIAPVAAITVTKPNVTVENFEFKINVAKLGSAVYASAANISNLAIKNNDVNPYRSGSAVTYSLRNAFSINYGAARVTGANVTGIVVENNKVTYNLNGTPADPSDDASFRAAVSTDASSISITGNTFQTVNQDVEARFAAGAITISNNNINGGGVEVSDASGGSGDISISNNTFNGLFSNTYSNQLRLKNNYTNRPTIVSGNTFINHVWGVSLENYQAVTMNNNTFTPASGSTTYRHVTLNTKDLTSSSGYYQPKLGLVFTNNVLNGSGAAGGTALAFYNHDNDNPQYGAITLGTLGNENSFDASVATYVFLDNSTGASTSVYATVPATTMAPWTGNIDAANNNFGGKLATAMTITELYDLVDKINDKVDISALGYVRVKAGEVYVTPKSYVTPATTVADVQRAIDAASNNDIVNIKTGTYQGGANAVTIAKDLTLSPGASAGEIILDMMVGDLVVNANDVLKMEINSNADYDKFIVSGDVDLTGATLVLILNEAYEPVATDKIVIIRNNGSNPVNGEFAQGKKITVGNNTYSIHYNGNADGTGLGNDVILTLAPTIACPSNKSVNTDPGACNAVVTGIAPTVTGYNSTLTYAITGAGTTTLSTGTDDASGLAFNVGVSTVTYTLTDGAGNKEECSFSVTVTDNENPVITMPTVAETYNADNGVCYKAITLAATAADNCGVAHIKYFLNYDDAATKAEISAENYHYPVGTTTVTVEVMDVHDNTVTDKFSVIVLDDQNPAITLPVVNASYDADHGKCTAALTFTAGTGDNCGVQTLKYYLNYATTRDAISFPYDFEVGTSTVTIELTDIHENTVIENFTVVVVDNQKPVIISCPTPSSSYDTDHGLMTTSLSFTATAEDNCGVSSIEYFINYGKADQAKISYPYLFPFGSTTVTTLVTDVHGNTQTCEFTIVVDHITTHIDQDGITLLPNSHITVPYSDLVSLDAKITPWPASENPSGVIEFYVSGEKIGEAVVNANGEATLADVPLLEFQSILDFNNYNAGHATNGPLHPGIKDIQAKFVSSNPNFLNEDATHLGALTISRENAVVTVDKSAGYFTVDPKNYKGTVWFKASVEDMNDGSRGDIRNATVQFLDGSSGTPIGPERVAGLVDPNDKTKGNVLYTFDYTLNNSELAAGGRQWVEWAEAGNYYTGMDNDLNVVTLAMPGSEYVTGGGHYIMENSAGLYAGTAGKRMNFGFNMKWNKSAKNLQGQINIVFRRMVDGQQRIFHLKSNAIDALAIGTANYKDIDGVTRTYSTATMTTKANLADVTDLTPVDLGGNLNLRVIAWDWTQGGSSGRYDKIYVEVFNGSTSQLLFSSYSSGSSTVRTINGGNINVRNLTTTPPACDQPVELTATDISESSAKLIWVGSAMSYNVQYRPAGGVWIPVPAINTTDLFTTVTGLTAGTTYEWSVQSVCTSGSSVAATSTFTTTADCNVAPGGLQTTNITSNSATLGWTSTGATGYHVQWRKQGALSTDPWSEQTVSTNSLNVTGLAQSSNYEWKVSNICGASDGLFSLTKVFTTPAPCPIPTGLYTSSITGSGATLNWNTATGAGSYVVNYRMAGDLVWNSLAAANPYISISGLTANSDYEWTVKSNCGIDASGFATVVSFHTANTTTCAVPTGLLTSNITTSSASFSWNAVSGALSYNFEYRAAGTASWATLSRSVNNASLSGLLASTTYEWRVSTICSSGTSVPSTVTTFATSSTACAASNLRITGMTSTSATLAWDGAASGTSFKLEWRKSGAKSWTATTTTAGSYTVTKLTTGTLYEWRVTATCGNTTGTPVSGPSFTAGQPLAPNTSALTPTEVDKYATGLMEVTAYPNPTVNSQFKLALKGFKPGNIEIRVIDANGRTLALRDELLQASTAVIPMNLGNIHVGLYIVQVRQNDRVKIVRVIKQ